MIPPTLGYEVPDPELDLDYVPGEARAADRRANGGPPVAISNSFAFGGHNVALVLRGRPSDERHCTRTPRPATERRSSGSRRCAIPAACRSCARACVSPRLGDRAIAGDGVVGATGAVAGRPIACYAQDGSYLGGSLGERHADTIVRVLETAGRARIPVVAFVESGGARMQEGTAALAGYGRIFRHTVGLTGVVPQISVVSGASAGGGAYSPALTDLIVMTEDAAMFLTGPGVVREALGEEIDAADARRPPRARPQRRLPPCRARRGQRRGAACAICSATCRRAPGEPPPRAAPVEPELRGPRRGRADRAAARLRRPRRAARRSSTRGSLLELCPRWARNVVTALARLDGRPVGIVANQPHHLGGVLDAEGSEKAARFVGFCDSFGLPLIAVVDTPGFMPGSRQEQAGVIRHGASLVRAFAAARVPKLTVVLRKSYGGAYITMNSRDLGADLVLAWPDAELGIMSARAAVGIVNRRELRVAGDPDAERARLADAYARRAPARRGGGRGGVRRRDRRAGRDARAAGLGAADAGEARAA